jgi:hypothetical protein
MPRRKRKQFYVRRKVCRFCVDANLPIDYKDVNTLRQFITERGKIILPHLGELRPRSGGSNHQTGQAAGLDFLYPASAHYVRAGVSANPWAGVMSFGSSAWSPSS